MPVYHKTVTGPAVYSFGPVLLYNAAFMMEKSTDKLKLLGGR
jgi:hypothetical protein